MCAEEVLGCDQAVSFLGWFFHSPAAMIFDSEFSKIQRSHLTRKSLQDLDAPCMPARQLRTNDGLTSEGNSPVSVPGPKLAQLSGASHRQSSGGDRMEWGLDLAPLS